jgi:hypothetical protein
MMDDALPSVVDIDPLLVTYGGSGPKDLSELQVQDRYLLPLLPLARASDAEPLAVPALDSPHA